MSMSQVVNGSLEELGAKEKCAGLQIKKNLGRFFRTLKKPTPVSVVVKFQKIQITKGEI